MRSRQHKELKRNYQQTPRPLGVFLIRNTVTDKVFLAAGIDLAGAINRHKYQLANDCHANRKLQQDWNKLGADKFAFEIVEQLEPLKDPSFNARRELQFMEKMWLERLKPFGEQGYNQKNLTRAEKLKRIARRTE